MSEIHAPTKHKQPANFSSEQSSGYESESEEDDKTSAQERQFHQHHPSHHHATVQHIIQHVESSYPKDYSYYSQQVQSYDPASCGNASAQMGIDAQDSNTNLGQIYPLLCHCSGVDLKSTPGATCLVRRYKYIAISPNNEVYKLDAAKGTWQKLPTSVRFCDVSMGIRDDSIYALGCKDRALYVYTESQNQNECFQRVLGSEHLDLAQLWVSEFDDVYGVETSGRAVMFNGKNFTEFGHDLKMVCSGSEEIWGLRKSTSDVVRLDYEKKWVTIPSPPNVTIVDLAIDADDHVFGITDASNILAFHSGSWRDISPEEASTYEDLFLVFKRQSNIVVVDAGGRIVPAASRVQAASHSGEDSHRYQS